MNTNQQLSKNVREEVFRKSWTEKRDNCLAAETKEYSLKKYRKKNGSVHLLKVYIFRLCDRYVKLFFLLVVAAMPKIYC